MEEAKELKQRLENTSDTEEVLEILAALSKLEISTEILKATGIGILINKKTKNSDPSVSALAKDLLNTWKNLAKQNLSNSTSSLSSSSSSVSTSDSASSSSSPPSSSTTTTETDKSTTNNNNNNNNNNSNGKKSESSSSSSSSSSKPLPSSSSSSSSTSSKPSSSSKSPSSTPTKSSKSSTLNDSVEDIISTEAPSSVDRKRKISEITPTTPKQVKTPIKKKDVSEYDFIKTGDQARDKVRQIIAEALGDAEDNEMDPIDASARIESELIAIYGGNNKDYKAKVRSLCFNLKSDKNIELKRDVLGGGVPISQLCRMSAQQMASAEEQEKRRKIEQWHLEACKTGQAEASTDQFLCHKCKQRKCTYYQLQTRSADEPMTTFVTCTYCGNRWKFC